MDEPNPLTLIKDTWRRAPQEILLPAVVGAAFAQLPLIFFVLRSGEEILLMACLVLCGFGFLRTLSFLYQIGQAPGSTLSARETCELYLPPIGAVFLYGLIAPNQLVALLFAIASLPHYALLVFTMRSYARTEPLPIKKLSLGALRFFRQIPEFRRP